MKYKLVPGKCETCAFGKEAKGVILCQIGDQRECIPGVTVYKAFEGPSETPPIKIIVPLTNGDRIRAMSNEQLAHFIDKRTGCPPENGTWHCAPENCRQCWLDWLNAEAKEEE